MGYSHEDGSEDTYEDLLTGNRCFSVVLGKILQDKEGMFVELQKQDKYPDDIYGKFVVYKDGGFVRIDSAEDEEEFENGLMVWLIDKEEEK